MQTTFDADQHRMLFYNHPIAHWPSGMALQNAYLIRSDEKTHVNFNAVASVKLLLPRVLQIPTNPCIKTECKIRKTKRLFPSLSELSLTSGGKILTAKGAQRLMSVLICLYAWGNDIMLRSYVTMILGLRKKPRVQTGNLTTRTVAVPLATSHGEQRSAVLQWAVVWTRALQAKNLQIKEPLANGCW